MGGVVGINGFGVGFKVFFGGGAALGTCVGTALIFSLCFGVSPASDPMVGSKEGNPVVKRLGSSVTSSIVGTGDVRVQIDSFGDELGVNDGRTKMLGCGENDGVVTGISIAFGTTTPLFAPHSGTNATVPTTVATPMVMAIACIEVCAIVYPNRVAACDTCDSPTATDPILVPKEAAEPTVLFAESIAKAWGTDALNGLKNRKIF